jgi:hypothetical protein
MVDLTRKALGKYFGALAVALSAIYPTLAQATCPTFHTLTNGTTADAAKSWTISIIPFSAQISRGP